MQLLNRNGRGNRCGHDCRWSSGRSHLVLVVAVRCRRFATNHSGMWSRKQLLNVGDGWSRLAELGKLGASNGLEDNGTRARNTATVARHDLDQ